MTADLLPADELALGFRCPQCRAEPGEPCVWRTRASFPRTIHLARQDRGAREFNRRAADNTEET